MKQFVSTSQYFEIIRNKRVFNYCQTSVLFLYKGATLVNKRANGYYTLAGTPTWRLVLIPLVAYSSTTIYIYLQVYFKVIEFVWLRPNN